MTTSLLSQPKHTLSHDFGLKGWGIMGYAALLLYFMTGLTVDGLNAIVPGMAALHGWDPNAILSISTPASIIALIMSGFAGKLADRLGLINATACCLAGGGIFLALYGNSVNLAMYAVCLTLMMAFINSFALVLGYSIVSNWFPRKKGIAYGWVTMGMNLASASIVIILTALSRAFSADPDGNIAHALTILGGVLIGLAVFTRLVVKATPEEAGALPDNEIVAAQDLHLVGESSEDDNAPTLGYGQILAQPKTWIFGLTYGFTGIATVGIMSQVVPFLMTQGFDLLRAIGTMTVIALIGLFGSWLWGVIDQLIGTRITTMIFAVWYALAILALINPPTLYLGLFMVGMGIGGNGNFPPSMATSLWGRHDFPNAFAVGNAILGVIRSLAFAILAAMLAAGLSFSQSYLVFAGISLLGGLLVFFLKVPGPRAAQRAGNQHT